MSKAFICVLIVLAVGQVLAEQHIISNDGNLWNPSTISIKKGDTIKFTYSASHNVAQSSSSESNEWNGGFRSGDVGANTEWEHGFATAGTFYFICEPHAAIGMKGTITVVDDSSSSTALTASFALVAGALALLF